MQLDKLIEAFLIEAAALTKGSQRVMANKQMVADLADTLRDDARMNPSSFPAGSSRTFQKTSDQELAQWFLENLDKIEREGYEGTVYSRDGVNSEWITRRYIAGSQNWEDITGVMNMNLRDWYLLKNRNMLDDNHKDLFKFNSVRDVGYYMTTHYKARLEKLRDAAKNAARNKMAKSVKLVDNDDYRIYTTLNRAAGCLLGLGTQWCTANSNYGSHFHTYTSRAMLFQLFPYAKNKDANGNLVNVTDEDGKKELADNEKYQFDAGGPSFMDATDRPADAETIKTKFPYIYTDLAKALKANKEKMSKAFEELSNDPTLQHEDYKIKTYEIDDEIEKLGKFLKRGYFTTEVRPSDKSSSEAPAGEQPQVIPAPGEAPAQQGQPMAESKLKTLGHIVKTTTFKPVGGNVESPLTYGDELEEEDVSVDGAEDAETEANAQQQAAQQNSADEINSMDNETPEDIIDDIMSMQNLGLSKSQTMFNQHELMNLDLEQLKQIHGQVMGTVTETDDIDAGADIGMSAQPGMGQQSNMAPTMPEGTIMEEIDKDVAAMLRSLKKYDMLAESVAPVMMARPKVVESEDAGVEKAAAQLAKSLTPEESKELQSLVQQGGSDPQSVGRAVAKGLGFNKQDLMSIQQGQVNEGDFGISPTLKGKIAQALHIASIAAPIGMMATGAYHAHPDITGILAMIGAVALNSTGAMWGTAPGQVGSEYHKTSIPGGGQMFSKKVNEDGAVEDFEASGGKVQKLPYMGGDQKGKSMASKHIGGSKGKKGDLPGKGRDTPSSSGVHPVVGQSKKKKANEEVQAVSEAADAEVLDWMKRFSKLGKMV